MGLRAVASAPEPDEPTPAALTAPDAERFIAGAVMRFPDALLDECAALGPGHFADEVAQVVFSAARDLVKARRPVNVLSVAETLRGSNMLECIGGVDALRAMVAAADYPDSIRSHVGIIIDRATRRRALAIGRELAFRAQAGRLSGAELLSFVERQVSEARSSSDARLRGVGFRALADQLAAWLHTPPESDTRPPIQTNIRPLDDLLGGLLRKRLIVVGARPRVGKSALAIQFVTEAARSGARAAVSSLEMADIEQFTRVVARFSKIPEGIIRQRYPSNFARVFDAIAAAADLPITVDDRADTTIEDVASFWRRLHATSGLDIAMLDYLQLVNVATARGETRERAVARVTQALKGLAKELDIPVLALAQLNRTADERPGGRPTMQDLRESGEIENSADVVMLLYRDQRDPEDGTIIIAKHRGGAEGDVPVRFRAAHYTFEERP